MNTYSIRYRNTKYSKMADQTIFIEGYSAARLVMEGLLKGGYDHVSYMPPNGSIFTQFVL